jgi:hypothetical protein
MPHPSTASPSTLTPTLCPAFFDYLPFVLVGFGRPPID